MKFILKGIPEVYLFQSDGIKTFLSKCRMNIMISLIQNTKSWNSFCIWTEFGQKCFYAIPIDISISLERLYQSFQFFHHCRGKSMTNLEMDIFSRFFLNFLVLKIKPQSNDCIFFFFTLPVCIFFFLLTRYSLICMLSNNNNNKHWLHRVKLYLVIYSTLTNLFGLSISIWTSK